MTTDYKVTELLCITDEFCKHFGAKKKAGKLLEDNSGVKRRRRAASLSDSEIMTILLYFHFGTFRNFKHYYLFFIKGTIKSYFPKAVSYNRFVELESRVFFQLMSDGMGREFVYLSSRATNRYFIPNWGSFCNIYKFKSFLHFSLALSFSNTLAGMAVCRMPYAPSITSVPHAVGVFQSR